MLGVIKTNNELDKALEDGRVAFQFWAKDNIERLMIESVQRKLNCKFFSIVEKGCCPTWYITMEDFRKLDFDSQIILNGLSKLCTGGIY